LTSGCAASRSDGNRHAEFDAPFGLDPQIVMEWSRITVKRSENFPTFRHAAAPAALNLWVSVKKRSVVAIDVEARDRASYRRCRQPTVRLRTFAYNIKESVESADSGAKS
jgi:hypothetical protein